MNNQSRIQTLLQKYYNNQATDDEINELRQLLYENEHIAEKELADFLLHKAKDPVQEYNPQYWNTAIEQIILTTTKAPVKKLTWKRWVAAASVFAVISLCIYFFSNSKPVPHQLTAATRAVDLLPGSDRAILTLSDGKKIELKGDRSFTDGTINITSQNNILSYSKTDVVAFNTMSTPRGGKYQVLLPDGSQAWLNAESSITYPTVFKGKTRSVIVEGEVYLKVAKDKSKPFIVQVRNNTAIEVLGTEFNVNSYRNESSINTTLVEGSVKVISNKTSIILTPNQQAQRNADGSLILAKDANIEQAIAWKKGIFNFQHLPFDVVMRQLSRWYDVDIEYPNGIPGIQFWGKVQRDLPLMVMLEGLDVMKVKFKLEGKKLIVLK